MSACEIKGGDRYFPSFVLYTQCHVMYQRRNFQCGHGFVHIVTFFYKFTKNLYTIYYMDMLHQSLCRYIQERFYIQSHVNLQSTSRDWAEGNWIVVAWICERSRHSIDHYMDWFLKLCITSYMSVCVCVLLGLYVQWTIIWLDEITHKKQVPRRTICIGGLVSDLHYYYYY